MNQDMNQQDYDVIVIGGGPSGAATATVLAQHGRRVLVLEREAFPRYHIGESLIPYCWYPLERLGMLEKMEQADFTRKYSVQFVSATGRVSQPFYFQDRIDHPCAVTWQVPRADFDALLLENAREHGVEVRQGVEVRDLLLDGERAVGVAAGKPGGETKEIHASYVADASGRSTWLASRMGWKQRDPDLNKISIFSYFKGGKFEPGIDAGATTVAYIPEKGWFWHIPLPGKVASVGVVAEAEYLYRDGRDPQTIFDREAQACSWINEHISGAEQIEPIRVTGEFSYRATQIAGDGFCLVGDAFSFLDPVFSSGVFLGLKGGEMAADAINAALDAGDVGPARFTEYEKLMRDGLDNFKELVMKFYDANFSFGQFIRAYPEHHPLLVDILVGNVYKDLKPLFDAMDAHAKMPPEDKSVQARR